jgi:hypothetical protein
MILKPGVSDIQRLAIISTGVVGNCKSAASIIAMRVCYVSTLVPFNNKRFTTQYLSLRPQDTII